MAYTYNVRDSETLEQYAEQIIVRFPGRRLGTYAIDVEGILEDLGLTILPRRGGLRYLVEGYRPRDPHYIVIPDEYASSSPLYRVIVAEELCHTILEYDLLKAPSLPAGSAPHELTPEQHALIERDAKYLAGALLAPRESFMGLFQSHMQELKAAGGDHGKSLRTAIRALSTQFVMRDLNTARRCRDLRLITEEDYKLHFLDRLPM